MPDGDLSPSSRQGNPSPTADMFEALYGQEPHPFGVGPSSGVHGFAGQFKPGSVLDLGCGDGRNTIYLAKRGFTVTGVDQSASGIRTLRASAAAAGLTGRVHGVVGNIAQLVHRGAYDNVISTVTLSYMSRVEGRRAIDGAMQATAPRGLHVIEDYVQMSDQESGWDRFLLTPESWRELYEQAGWKVVHLEIDTVFARPADPTAAPIPRNVITVVASRQ